MVAMRGLKAIGQMLLGEKIITLEQLELALREQKEKKEYFCRTLVRLGLAKEEDVFPILATQLQVAFVKIKELNIPPEVIKKVPAKFVSHYKLMPIALKGNILTMAMSDPVDVHTIDDLRLFLAVEIEPVLAGDEDIAEAIRKYYGVGAETLEEMIIEKGTGYQEAVSISKAEDLTTMAEDASIVKFVNQIMLEALKDRATDIHMEPFENQFRVRFRIDGILYDITIPPSIRIFNQAIVSRIKIMSSLDIAEHRLPQDGRMKIKVEEKELDLRISIVPSSFGESVHIRILSPESFLELEKLGHLPEDLKIIESLIKKPHGIIFVTGPTGSGKTTSLYACLAKINVRPIKIITIEDPIEYQLKGITQIQIAPKIGLTFANGLRSMLRHDPDIMMVGEVRDYETAEIAIRAALTGHLVFSTLHTNDAAGAITRLLDMGVEPFLVSSSLECLIAQRLVRLVCPACKHEINPDKKYLQGLGLDIEPNIKLFEGKGCAECRFTGYRGRTGIYEILLVNGKIRDMVIRKESSQQIKKEAVLQGMKTLRLDGWQKVKMGLTTVAEIIRVTQQEELPE
ncbi:MAG: GspE/PulE family protein [Candidatus Omnitrophota bacterium]